MKIHRFFVKEFLQNNNQDNRSGRVILNDKDIIHQIERVLRLKIGEQIVIFDGVNNFDYLCKTLSISKKEIELQISENIIKNKLNTKLNLFISVVKSDFELIIREATELGVSNIYPIISERVEKKQINLERLDKISIEASEQSGRNDIVQIHDIQKLDNAIEHIIENNLNKVSSELKSNELSIVYHTDQIKNDNILLRDFIDKNKIEIINIFIGPEGGWGNLDLELFDKLKQNKAAVFIKKLNTNILRATTASAVCVYDSSLMLNKDI